MKAPAATAAPPRPAGPAPRDIVDALLRKKPAPRIGLVESPWPDTIAAWVKQGYPTRRARQEAGALRWNPESGRWQPGESSGEFVEPVPAWEHFGFDLVGVGGWFDAMPLRGRSELVEKSDAWEVRRNGAGAALKYWTGKSGTPEHVDFLMTSREAWERDYRPHLLGLDPARVDANGAKHQLAAARAAGRWTHYGHLFIWELMRQSMGDVCLYESLLLDPDWIRDYGRVYTDFFQRHYAYLFEQAGRPDGVWMYEDLGYRNGLAASPRVLEDLIFPHFKEMVDFFHARGLPVVLHTCGSTAEALPLIVEAGFDALHPMERKAAGNDPFAFAERYGDRLAFVGGFDARLFETNDRALIRREMTGYIRGMRARGARLVFASDHSISPNTRYDTYAYAVEVWRELAANG
jgi:uroporphyrinogen decarboxylase